MDLSGWRDCFLVFQVCGLSSSFLVAEKKPACNSSKRPPDVRYPSWLRYPGGRTALFWLGRCTPPVQRVLQSLLCRVALLLGAFRASYSGLGSYDLHFLEKYWPAPEQALALRLGWRTLFQRDGCPRGLFYFVCSRRRSFLLKW